jgi:peptide/nickel transport system permease protein
MQLREALRELWRSGAGKGGVFLMILLVGGAVYSLIAFPADFGNRVWSNPTVWVDNPKAVPPVWVNRLRSEPLPEHLVLEAMEPTERQEVSGGLVLTYRFPFDYPYQNPPTFLALTLGDVTYAERAPAVLVSLVRPDGAEIHLYRHAVRGPREGEISPYHRYADEPLRVQLNTEETTLTAVQEYLEGEHNISSDGRSLGGQIGRLLFGTPTGNSLQSEPLTGPYEVRVRVAVRNPDDTVGLVRFVVGGAVFGLIGSDTLGRDLAQGLLFGLPVALFIGVLVALVSTAIGTTLGILSGYVGGGTDLLIQRLSDILANVPVLPLLIFMLFVIGPSLYVILFVLIAFSWMGMTIQVRSMVLHMRTNQLVEAIQSLGASHRRVMFRHILPQIAPYVLAHLIFAAPAAILAEAGLSFLGLGDPSIPTWGQILENGFRTGGVYVGYWWWIIPPGVLIAITALTFMLISLGLEPVVNPRLRRTR